jgi:hypothetical protein
MLGFIGNLGGGEWVLILVGLFLIYLFFKAIFEIVSSKTKSATEKAIWILVLLFLSGIGLIAYYLFGRKNK